MSTTLCETFRSLAFKTHDQLAKARRVNHQPLEETFTDLNILELKDRHPFEVYSKTFNKRQEGVNGADWEWWLTNSSRTSWLGLRVQAKILQLGTNTFPHLHYRSGKSKIYQLDMLRAESAREGLVPLYCFFTHYSAAASLPKACMSFAHAPESYGCSIASLEHVSRLQKAGDVNDLGSVLSGAAPWHCLVCCNGDSLGDLPASAWAYLQATFGVEASDGATDMPRPPIAPGPRPQPPPHVYSTLEGDEPVELPSNVQGILVIVQRDGG